MKNSKFVLLLIFGLLTMSLCAIAQDSSKTFRMFGVGASFQPFGISNILEEIEGVPLTKINFAVNATKFFRAELDLGLLTYNDKTYDEKASAILIGIGLLGTKRIDNNVIMGGLKFDFTKGRDSYEDDFGEDYEDTFNRIAVGPVFAYEYLFGGRFGVGAEVGLKFSRFIYTYDEVYLDEDDEEESTSTYTDAGFFVRFYF